MLLYIVKIYDTIVYDKLQYITVLSELTILQTIYFYRLFYNASPLQTIYLKRYCHNRNSTHKVMSIFNFSIQFTNIRNPTWYNVFSDSHRLCLQLHSYIKPKSLYTTPQICISLSCPFIIFT